MPTPTVEEMLNSALGPYQVEVRFGKKAVEDLTGYKKEQQETILAYIIARGKKGPLIRPAGIGEPLHGELSGFTKIKPKHLSLRIVYRPRKEACILMEIIAIGPRDRDKVYRMAARRVMDFDLEMPKV